MISMSEITLKVCKSMTTEILLRVCKIGREDMYCSLSIVIVLKFIRFTYLKYHLYKVTLKCTLKSCNV